MKILVVGSGGREHVLADRLVLSPSVEAVYCAPGNGGTEQVAINVAISTDDHAGLADFAIENKIDLTVVGPEAPLCGGIVDRFESAELRIFGPTAAAARIEGDKAYAKQLMRKALVPTAEGRIFSRYEDARTYVATRDTPQVVKASGLAAGKGVFVCDDPAQALLVLEDLMVHRRLGQAGATVVVEEKLKGREVSILALVDGHTIYVLESAQDHKRIGEGDTGPNTGGMGAFSPSPALDEPTYELIESEVLVPIVDALANDGAPFRGVLYAGIMLTAGGPKVLEFNCRLGDPEAQVVLTRLRSDLAVALDATVRGKLADVQLEWDDRPAVCVVMASEGYPGEIKSGRRITGLEEAGRIEGVKVFHSGTRTLAGPVVTASGRVLGVTALGHTLADARDQAYRAVDCIHFEGAQTRRDIAASA